ncbi:MAG: dTDP-4-dehydrorhamnose reductase [Bacteroidales bacterium]|jgi:dTDP-4-dehydrorhamnose reductase|nr:dTDP-4-dehydrorhamnose reductase [Bacteroidales bacterium]
MTTILVTGASGQLGSEIRERSARYSGYEFIFTDADELDITDAAATASFITACQPTWVINCAAYTAVDRAEDEVALATAINAGGVENLVSALRGTSCRLIHISTDYVFDGTSPVPYTEDDTPSPDSAYGRSKLAGEKAAMKWPDTMIIRTSWLYSSYGNNFVKTILGKAGSAQSLSVVFDQAGSPTYAADLAAAIIDIISGVIRNSSNFVPGIFNYSNEGVCSWFDLASEIVKEAGSPCAVLPVRSSAWPSRVKRPAYSVLDKTRIRENYNLRIPHWRTSLINCISKMNRI